LYITRQSDFDTIIKTGFNAGLENQVLRNNQSVQPEVTESLSLE
jgi:hypothetical protein